jgi:Asp-tRNA(Asn)/Glu-tRNA(Gln) amidotransferase B subunit
MKYEAVIGLEVHAQLQTNTKIFCGCETAFGEEANTRTCPVCIGMPGVLPVLNRKAVEYIIKTGLATPGRTTSIPTSRKATRSRSTSCRSARKASSRSWWTAR